VAGESNRTIQEAVDAIYRAEGARVLATLIRLLGDFDLAEDAMQAAFTVAVEQWERDGIPANPRAWLVSTGRFRAIDAIRRDTRLFASLREVAQREGEEADLFPTYDETSIEDDRLRLIFTCCHPSLSYEGQIALTLREVCGLTTEEIARAFLTSPPTIGQRIVRAKAKIREESIPYEIPPLAELSERTERVLQVTYLLYNEGYYASSGESVTRQVLSDEAIRLGLLVAELMPSPGAFGLLGLMLLNEARRAARVSGEGDIVLFADQDRALWDRTRIEEGLAFCRRAFESPNPGPYAFQAGIAAEHVEGALRGQTDWDRIVALYDLLLAIHPSAVVELNRAAAISMRDGPLAGLVVVDELLAGGELEGYGLAHAARGDFCRRLGRAEEAAQAYTRALELTTQTAERRFLESRLREVSPL
jgi:RNA polymerase sigma-70 factor (ECF subfamily)